MLIVAAVAGVAVLREGTYRADPPETTEHRPRPAGAARALHELTEAIAAREPRVGDLAPADAPAARGQLRAVVANAAALDVADFAARYVDELGAVRPDGSWTAAVDVTWRFAGFDRETARTEVAVTFAPRGQRTAIESIGGGGRRTPLWLRERLAVVRTPQALVLVAGTRAEARQHAERVRRGIPVVRQVLSRWRPSVVVEVPASADDLDETLGVEPGTYAGIAAVTTTVDGSGSTGSPVHVFVNPEVTDRLRRRGAQVVMSHELVHVATDAATSSVDLWLLEGFADYVALRGVPLPLPATAARAVALVQRDGAPSHLPDVEAFDTGAEDLQAAYELAWLACLEIVEASGEDALVATYRAAGRGVPAARALRRHAGLSIELLVTRWQDRLRELAR